ncbi:MAG: hypothetical protein JNN18_19930 [Rubrivivax sp.]|nr:hypothetical protein [Rubrivivax sp.]
MRRFVPLLALAGLLSMAPAQAAVTTTADLVAVAPAGVGSWTYSVGGWLGGGVVTGSFAGTDTDADGQLSWFDGEVTAFTMAYSGGSIVAPVALGFGDLFGFVYDLDGGPLGDGLALDVEGIGATGGGVFFAIGPGPVGLCGTGAVCGSIDGPAAAIPAAPALPLALAGLIALAATRRRTR